ncbi:uncharacterized protein LODBEIA_P38850 [Lodderomyces beijingensis]|uniref:Ras modification protein ERF4 n=1 Tax=Lodderomyces beijingensis TaxID=1775926 RepID=A0ABP0ZRW3_9ASCO
MTNHVNDKYNIGNAQETPPDLVFFNYHEYLVSQSGGSESPVVVVNHFPNHYKDQSSVSFKHTRVVRIPRCYDIQCSDLIPQFSIFYPGQEPGAIKSEESNSVTATFDQHEFGVTSEILQLRQRISEQDLLKLVTTINFKLQLAFNPFSVWTLCENICNVLTGGLFLSLTNFCHLYTYSRRQVTKLEAFIRHQNEQFQKDGVDLVITSPRKTAYLSLDIQVSNLIPS